MAIADRALDDAVGGRGGTLLLTGEPGIGKSAVAREVAARAQDRGAVVGFGRAWEVGGAPAFWPWSQALSELGLDLDEHLGSASSNMASAQRLVAFDRVVRAVCTVKDAPVVVILDDLHAADAASLELALAFARVAGRKRALLVATTRESELLERREVGDLVGKISREGVAVPLRRLAPSETATWLGTVGFLGDAARVHRLSEGNPLFIEEALRLGVDTFATAAAGGVAVVLAEHLARISAPTREILSVASVFGREAPASAVAALAACSADVVETARKEGQLAGVLSATRGEPLVFAHVLLRDALYDALAPSRRRTLHAGAAARLEAEKSSAVLVAQHLLAAEDVIEAPRAAKAVCAAAEAESARHAFDSAQQLIASGRARLAGRLDEASALRLDLTEVAARMREVPSDEVRARCADCASRAKRLGLPRELAQAALTYGSEILPGRVDGVMVTQLEDALAALEAAAASADPEEDAARALRARVLSRLSAALVPAPSDEVQERLTRYARESLALARSLDDVPTLLHALLWSLQGIDYDIPREEAAELTSELISLAREHDAPVIIANAGPRYILRLRDSGRPLAARREAEAFYRLIESLPLPAVRWRATAVRASMAALDGRLDDARRGLDELRQTAAVSHHAAGCWAMSEISFCTATNDLARYRDVAAEVEQVMGIKFGKPWLAPGLALLGRGDDAQALLAPPETMLRGLPPILVQGQAAVLLQSVELAEMYYEPLRRVAGYGRLFWAPGGGFPIGPVSRVLGELALLRGEVTQALEHFDSSIAECLEMEAALFLPLAEAGRARAVAASETRPRAPAREDVGRAQAREPETQLTLARDGDVWTVSPSAGLPFRVRHAKGLDYLQYLLENPGREVYVLALAGAGEGPEDAGAILDQRAKQAYRERVEDLEDQLAEAEQMGDTGRAARARDELEALAEQLAAAVGLGGRDRKAASNVERARVNVQRRVKDGIRRIAEHDGALGRYLEATVRTGTYCVYRPV